MESKKVEEVAPVSMAKVILGITAGGSEEICKKGFIKDLEAIAGLTEKEASDLWEEGIHSGKLTIDFPASLLDDRIEAYRVPTFDEGNIFGHASEILEVFTYTK